MRSHLASKVRTALEDTIIRFQERSSKFTRTSEYTPSKFVCPKLIRTCACRDKTNEVRDFSYLEGKVGSICCYKKPFAMCPVLVITLLL